VEFFETVITEEAKQSKKILLTLIKKVLFGEKNLTVLSIFNKDNEDNVLDKTGPTNLPVQVNSVIDSFAHSNTSKWKFDKDPFEDIEKLAGLLFNYKVIGSIKYVKGFKNNSTEIIWEKINPNILNSKQKLICRIEYYINPQLGIQENAVLHRSTIMGQHFILE